MSSQLFPRAWRVIVGDLDVSNLDVEFKVLSTLKPEPNKCVLTIWNLSQDHRAELLNRGRLQGQHQRHLLGRPARGGQLSR
jgi:isochorismate hydrolase